MKHISFLIVFVTAVLHIHAQCFNMSDLHHSSIVCTYGNYSNPYANVGVISNRHVVNTNPNERDQVISNLLTIPKGDSISIRLGNSNTHAEAESITFDYVVDADNPILVLKYAAVMEDPGHTPAEQPRLRLEVLNASGVAIDPLCTSFDFIASPNLGWNSYSGGSILWKDWTNIGVDMSPYIGEHVKIRLTNYDCDQGGHFGYAYINLGCVPKKILGSACGDVVTVNLSAPAGFDYTWYTMNGSTKVPFGTAQNVTIPVDGKTYYCDIAQVGKPSCSFTLSTDAKSKYPIADFDIRHVDSCIDTLYLTNTSGISNDGITKNTPLIPCDYVLWDLGDGRKVTTYDISQTPITYTNGGEYTITLTAYLLEGGCSHTVQKKVKVGGVNDSHECVLNEVVCSGQSYNFNGQQLTQSGTYVETIALPGGCDSITTLNLTVCPKYYFVDSVTLCQGEEIIWQGKKVRNRGKFFAKYKTVCGCDSIYELNVHVNPSYYEEITEAICGGETYTFGGQILHQSGVYIDSAMSMYGCDSVTKLILTKYDSYLIDEYIETCYDDTFYFRGQWVEEQGVYYDSLLTRHGCDSVYRLIYNKAPGFVFYSEEYICKGETYNFRGRELTKAGLYCDTLRTESGCDSIYQLQLRYHPDYFVPNNVITDSSMYNWHGKLYTEPGVYYDSLRTVNGCDSILQLTLTFENYTHIHHAEMLPICADDPVGQLVVNYSGTTPKYCHLFYSPEALAEGFKNISNIPFTGDTIIVKMPNKSPYITPDKYDVTLHLDNGVTQSEYNVEFLLSYPSWIIQQNWQDVVAVLNAHNNGGYYFNNYEWYVNRQAISSHTSYLYSPQLKVGDEVLVYLTREGENYSIPTCPLIIEEHPNINEHPTVVYPTKLAKGQKNITVETGKQGCAYYLCDLLGRTIATGECDANELKILEIPQMSGTLFMHIIESETQFSHTTCIYVE